MSVATATASSGARSTSTSSRHEPRCTMANAHAWPTLPTPTMPIFPPARSAPITLPPLDSPPVSPAGRLGPEARVDLDRPADRPRHAGDDRSPLALLVLV